MAGTLILTPNGYVPVQTLQSGQEIVEYSLANGTLVTGTFISANATSVTSVLDINEGLLFVTPTDQPIYIHNSSYTGWLRNPQNLTLSDSLFDPVTGEWIHVTSLGVVYRTVLVYDVDTSGLNNFIAHGVLLDKKIG